MATVLQGNVIKEKILKEVPLSSQTHLPGIKAIGAPRSEGGFFAGLFKNQNKGETTRLKNEQHFCTHRFSFRSSKRVQELKR